MRLFIGIDLPMELKKALLTFQGQLRDSGINGYWKSQDNFHITLEFMGELESSRVPVLREAMLKAVENKKPFGISIEGLGGFPNLNRPYTLWSAIQGNLGELTGLKDDLHRELEQKEFILENRIFKPHITLASRPSLKGVDLSIVEHKSIGNLMVQRITLFESSSIKGNRVYTDLFSAELEHSSN